MDHTDVRGVWIWGPPGVGKSHKARADYPNSYIKAQNIWWDGYQGQSSVIIDDLDNDNLSHYLKIWADKHNSEPAQVKGGSVPLLHDTLIITSNFSIEEIFYKNPITAQAIRRRFKIIHMTNPYGGLGGTPPLNKEGF